jgi:hypothetical protein
MSTDHRIGDPPWTREELLARLEQFATLYERRPFGNNQGGMSSVHMFLFWFVLQHLNPRVVIESGVWRGLGTWFIEQACPHADIWCIDPNLEALRYRSTRAQYLSEDISRHDWSACPKDSTVVFFDDHVNALDRMRLCVDLGFRHLIFEDNYPVGVGDCYSLKQALACAGHRPARGPMVRLRRLLGRVGDTAIPANSVDAAYIREHSEVLTEMPPVFTRRLTRWGTPWDEHYGTPEPLLSAVAHPWQQIYFDEAGGYTWLCYVRLKS